MASSEDAKSFFSFSWYDKGPVIREVTMRTVGNTNNAFSETAQGSRLTRETSNPGILVLAPTMKILYVNRRAWELAGRLGQVELSDSTDHAIPPVLAEVCAIVRTALEARAESDHADQFECKRVIGESGRCVRIHGFGLPNRLSFSQSRIVIVLDELKDVPSNFGDNGALFVDQPMPMREVA
jgi:PAS domain-containing protein